MNQPSLKVASPLLIRIQFRSRFDAFDWLSILILLCPRLASAFDGFDPLHVHFFNILFTQVNASDLQGHDQILSA